MQALNGFWYVWALMGAVLLIGINGIDPGSQADTLIAERMKTMRRMRAVQSDPDAERLRQAIVEAVAAEKKVPLARTLDYALIIRPEVVRLLQDVRERRQNELRQTQMGRPAEQNGDAKQTNISWPSESLIKVRIAENWTTLQALSSNSNDKPSQG